MDNFTIETDDRIGVVTLSRPPVNALSRGCYVEMRDLFRALGKAGEADAAVLRSDGRFFCPGNDVNEFLDIKGPDDARAYAQDVSDGISAIYECEIPVVAAVHGHAFGAGMAMAACADVIVAGEGAQFAIPEIKVGVIGAAGFFNLIAPEKVVRRLSLTGEPISAAALAEFGGVHKVVPQADVFAEAMDAARAMLRNGPTALRYFKAAMNINQGARLAEKYAVEIGYGAKLSGSPEAREAALSFLEKRAPKFR